MLSVLSVVALAASPPPLDAPVVSGMRSKKDAAVVVGVEDFATLPDAVGAKKDAAAVRAWLVDTRGLDPARVTVVEDPDGPAAKDAIAHAAKSVKRNGTLWVFWSGHGAFVDGERVLLGKGADASAPAGDAVLLDDVVALVEASRAKQAVVLLDVGFGGAGRDGEPPFA
ncbi:MAG: caspase family protein, partial [Myxococcota bacterium]